MALTKIGASLGGGADTIFVTQAGHGLTLGYPVKASGNGTYAHATADTAANAEAIGIIIESTTDTMLIALSGRITVDGVVPNLSAGTVLFLQVAAGLLAAAEPSGNTQVSKPMAVITYANSEMILLAHRGEVISTAGITLADESVDSDHYVDGSIDNVHLADNAVDTEEIADDAVTADKLANSINSAIAANTAKVTNATHTGDVTGATALTIATDAVDIAMLSASGTADGTTFLRGDNQWAAAGVTDISCRVYSSAAQSITQNSDVTITWNQENYDTDTMHDNSTNNSRIKATTAGKYLIVCNIEWAAGITGWRNHYLYVNGSTTIGSTRLMALDASKPVYNLVTIWDFSTNDYVELRVHQNATAARTVNNGAGVTFLAMHKIN